MKTSSFTRNELSEEFRLMGYVLCGNTSQSHFKHDSQMEREWMCELHFIVLPIYKAGRPLFRPFRPMQAKSKADRYSRRILRLSKVRLSMVIHVCNHRANGRQSTVQSRQGSRSPGIDDKIPWHS